jgi:hypothetical protein
VESLTVDATMSVDTSRKGGGARSTRRLSRHEAFRLNTAVW